MKRNKIADIILSLLIAVGLWIYVVTVVTPEDDISIQNIPVTFVGETELRSEGLVLSNRSADSVALQFHGARSDLKRLLNDKGGIVVTVDVSGCTEERNYSAGYSITLPSALQDADIQVTDRKPKTIQFDAERLETKAIPIKGLYDGTFAEGYMDGGISFDRDSITATGPKDIIRQLDYAQVIMGGSEVSKSLTESLSFTLVDKNGEPLNSADVTTDVMEIETTLRVLMKKDIPLVLDIIPGGGATEENTEITITPESVTVCGEPKTVEALKKLELGSLELGAILTDRMIEYPIVLPEGVSLPGGEASANVEVKFGDLSAEQVTITSLTAENVSDGLQAYITETELPVTLRGEQESIENLRPDTLVAVADMSEYLEAGSYEVPITVRSEEDTIGAVGEYTVTVVLEKTAEE